MRPGEVPESLSQGETAALILHDVLDLFDLRLNILGLSEPPESQPGLVRPAVAEQPERRLRDRQETTEVEEAENHGDSRHSSPVEAGTQAVRQQNSQAQHQSVERQESSSVLQ